MPFNGIVDSKNTGIVVDLLEEATKHGAPKFNYQLGLPWKRAQQMLLNSGDKPVAIVPFTRTKHRENQHLWIAKLIDYQTRISTNRQISNISLDSMLDKSIGIIRGSAHIPALKQLGFVRLSETNSAIENARKLASGQLYAIAESQYVDTFNWKKLGLNTKNLLFVPIGEPKEIYIAGNVSFPQEIAKQIEMALLAMHQNGTTKRILNSWEN